MANAYWERILGTPSPERLDFLIPFGEEHLRRVVRIWQGHYNTPRPHSQLGPGLRQPPPGLPAAAIIAQALPRDTRIVARPIFGGLRHAYGLERLVA